MRRVVEDIRKTKSEKSIIGKIIPIILILGLIIFVVVLKNFFTIRNMEIVIIPSQGNSETTNDKVTKENIMELSGLSVGKKLYKDLRSQISSKIEQNPYVKDAKIERNLSGKLKITVTEREPDYLINYSGEYIYIDKEGYILELSKENNGKPVIIGLTTDCSKLSIGKSKIRLNKSDLDKIEIINNILSCLDNNEVKNKISSIDASDKKEFILQLEEDKKTVYIGDGSDINTRVLYMKKILEAEAGNSGIIYVNGKLDERYAYFKEQ